ncbi:monooxygenase [Neohortaea acidophila]|uniref:Monooxygenase n=1 Tax=Neohortaea acidophila TaxID=245834 RepID=A0A6A6PQ71_9PEZI|nr:monooxygenase [Neohortaea acidophila]KAF2481593.1 monooxygenase [Neohortaea acidophila]
MSQYATHLNAIIIGAGPAGIAMAYQLKHKLGFNDFTIYEKLDGVGGTWRTNSYPGCGCDLPSHLYSFSFNLNPDWSQELCEQPEILRYMEDTVDKFDLRKHVHSSVECIGAEWQDKLRKWRVQFKDLQTGIEYSRYASVFVSAVGAISFPRDVKFAGMEDFKGPMFHTARWNHSVSWKGKRVAVIGNGCSAAQVVPALAKDAAFVKQYARSAQWYHARPNHKFTAAEKWAFRWVPLWQRLLRLTIFLEADEQTTAYFPSPKGQRVRATAEKESTEYIKSKAPKKYWDFIVPDFPLGCKRRIFDPDYLDSLQRPNVELLNHGIEKITETGIVSSKGDVDNFDIIVLGTGFQVAQFLTPMEIVGANGANLQQQWDECRGAQAYMGTYVHNFPNLAIIFGPNTFPANNSALFACETQVDYAVKSLFRPLLDGRADIIEVKQSAEDSTTQKIHEGLAATVFAGDCSNWYIGKHGRNTASWPGLARSFWLATYFPDWKAFNMQGGSKFWPLRALERKLRFFSSGNATAKWLAFLIATGIIVRDRTIVARFCRQAVDGLRRGIVGLRS